MADVEEAGQLAKLALFYSLSLVGVILGIPRITFYKKYDHYGNIIYYNIQFSQHPLDTFLFAHCYNRLSSTFLSHPYNLFLVIFL